MRRHVKSYFGERALLYIASLPRGEFPPVIFGKLIPRAD